MSRKKVTGAILAGGKNSRMGADKGLLTVEGKKIIERIIEALNPVVDEIIIISNSNSYDYLGYKVYSDSIKNCGPMGGIHAALTYSETKRNLIVGCDMPFVSKNVLSAIIERAEEAGIAIPEHDEGKVEPLCAMYSKSCLNKFAKLLESGDWKLNDALKYFSVKEINFTEQELSENYFLNINTPEEYRTLRNYDKVASNYQQSQT